MKPDKSPVMNMFLESLRSSSWIEFIEALRDVSLDEPCGSFPLHGGFL